MAGLKGLVGDTVWYGLSSIIGRLINYLLVPLHTAVFLPGEFGVLTELYAYVGFLYIMYTYGMETAYFRFANNENEEEVFNTSLSSILITSLLFSGIIIYFGQEIATFLGYAGKESAIYYLAAIIAIDAIAAIPYARLRLEKKAKTFALIRLGMVLMTVILNLVFFVVFYQSYKGDNFVFIQSWVTSFYDFDFKVKYVFLANMLANAIAILFLMRYWHGFKLQVKWGKLKLILVYAFPLMFMGLAAMTNEMLSRTLLKYWLPEGYYEGQSAMDALGIFGACYKLSVFMLLGIQAFRYAAEPFFFSEAKKSDSPQTFSKIMTGFVAFNAVVLVAVSLNLELISTIFLTNKAYHEGLIIVPILLLAYLFNGIYYNLSVWYKLTDRTAFGAYITGFGAILTVVLNFVLIPVLGYFGSAIATLLTFFLMTVLSYVYGQKYYPIPYQVTKILEYLVIASIVAIVFYLLGFESLFMNFIVKNFIVLLFCGYIYWRERAMFKGKSLFGVKFP